MSDEGDGDSLFREAMSDVVPIAQKRVAPQGGNHEVSPAQLERRDAAEGRRPGPHAEDPNFLSLGEVRPVEPRDMLAWKKDGVQNEVFRKLRSARYPLEGRLDLHRHTVREARKAVFDFLTLAQRKGWRTVLILHGRGEQSATPARLKSYVAHWLTQVSEVIAYHSAGRQHGGTGAVYVLLKKSREASEATRERYGQQGDP